MSENNYRCIKRGRDGNVIIKLTTPFLDSSAKPEVKDNYRCIKKGRDGNEVIKLTTPFLDSNAESKVESPEFDVLSSTKLLTYLLLKITSKNPDIKFTNKLNILKILKKNYLEFNGKTLKAKQINDVYKMARDKIEDIERKAKELMSRAATTMEQEYVPFITEKDMLKDAFHIVLEDKTTFEFSKQEKDFAAKIKKRKKEMEANEKAKRQKEEQAKREAEEQARKEEVEEWAKKEKEELAEMKKIRPIMGNIELDESNMFQNVHLSSLSSTLIRGKFQAVKEFIAHESSLDPSSNLESNNSFNNFNTNYRKKIQIPSVEDMKIDGKVVVDPSLILKPKFTPLSFSFKDCDIPSMDSVDEPSLNTSKRKKNYKLLTMQNKKSKPDTTYRQEEQEGWQGGLFEQDDT